MQAVEHFLFKSIFIRYIISWKILKTFRIICINCIIIEPKYKLNYDFILILVIKDFQEFVL